MNSNDFLSKLGTINGVDLYRKIEDSSFEDLHDIIKLPEPHLNILKATNGIRVYGGYFHLFGFKTNDLIDMLQWNSYDLWAFAWNQILEKFWFFGETAWGDQYAYLREELEQSLDPKIYFLEGITMQPEVIAENFSSFLENEFLRNASQPYDENLITVRKKIGDLKPFEHIVYTPSLLITGEEDVNSVSKLDASSAMIINGDLFNQLAEQHDDRDIKKIETYEDSNGRTRIKVIWK